MTWLSPPFSDFMQTILQDIKQSYLMGMWYSLSIGTWGECVTSNAAIVCSYQGYKHRGAWTWQDVLRSVFKCCCWANTSVQCKCTSPAVTPDTGHKSVCCLSVPLSRLACWDNHVITSTSDTMCFLVMSFKTHSSTHPRLTIIGMTQTAAYLLTWPYKQGWNNGKQSNSTFLNVSKGLHV